MVGFVKNNLRIILKDLKLYIIMWVLIAISVGRTPMQLMIINTLYFSLSTLAIFAYNEKSNFYTYAAAFPRGRDNLVKGTYLTQITLILLSVLLNIITIIVLSLLLKNFTFSIRELVGYLLVGIGLTLFYISILFPINFKFGSNRGRIFMFILIFGTSSLGSLLFNGFANIFVKIGIERLMIGVFILGVLAFLISFLISQKIVKNKDY